MKVFFPKELSHETESGIESLEEYMFEQQYDPSVEKYIFIPNEEERVEILNEDLSEPRRIAQALMKELEGMEPRERTAVGLLVMGTDYHAAMENYFNNREEKPALVAALLQRLIKFRSFHGLRFNRISTRDMKVERIAKAIEQ